LGSISTNLSRDLDLNYEGTKTEMSISDCLKDMAAKHSYMKVHTELLALMKEEYTTLKAFFEPGTPKKKPASTPSVAPAPPLAHAPPDAPSQATAPVAVQEELSTKFLANTKIRIIKDAGSPEPVSSKMSSKDLKAWQKEQELKKLAELTSAGITPESLLTAESIKRWIDEEGRTFAYVAREFVGLPEATVAEFAKGHGVKSKISKARAILSAKNRQP
jgi:hypothetical protein